MNLKFKHFGVAVCACLCACMSLSAKVEKTAVYMFGFSASFTDSVAYITDIQCVDTAYVETKSGFLMDRVVYSDQLKTYLEGVKKMNNSTCAVFFSTKKKDVLAEYNKIRKRYEKDENVILKTTEEGEFRFQSPGYYPQEKAVAKQNAEQQPKKSKKKRKASATEPMQGETGAK